MLNSVDSKAIYIERLHKPYDPIIERLHDCRIFGVKIWERKNIVANGTIFYVGLVVELSYSTRIVIE